MTDTEDPAPGDVGRTLVDVSVRVTPPVGAITLDNTPLGRGGYEGRLERNAVPHKLVVTAPGYTTVERLITLDHDLRVEIALEPADTGSADSSPSTTPVDADAGTAAATKPRPLPPPVRQPPDPKAQRQHNPMPIETSDPYGRGPP